MHRSQVRQTLHYFARPHRDRPAGAVGGPAAWRAPAVRADPSWRITLEPAEVAEVQAAVARSLDRGRPLSDLSPADFPLPTLARRIDCWRSVLADGRGFVLLRGLPVDRWSQAESERCFYGLGLHLGIPGAQNPEGDLLGHVRDQGFADQTEVRAYRTRTRIAFHCDAADVVGLLCLHQAARGGESRIASSVAVHDELWARRPDLAALLYQPFQLDTKGEGGLRYFPVIPCRHRDGVLRTFYHADYFRSVERHADAPRLSAAQHELLELYDQLASSPELCLEMDFLPGDVQLLSNHTTLHGRGAYEDDGPRQRHLLRLWLSLPGRHGSGGALWPMAQLVATLARSRVRQRRPAPQG